MVHAGLVPGIPLAQQRLFDLEKMRDVIPAAEQAAADAAVAALAAGDSVADLPTGSFDWGAAAAALAQQAAEEEAAEGRGEDGDASTSGSAADGNNHGLPPALRLLGREQQNPLGRAWASVWPGRLPGHAGPLHVFFGHDAVRRVRGL